MSRYQLAYGHYLSFRGSIWEIESLDQSSKVLKLNRMTDSLKISMPLAEAYDHLANDNLEFVDSRTVQKPLINAEQHVMADFSTKSPCQKNQALRRSTYLKMLEEHQVQNFTSKYLDPLISKIAQIINDPNPPSSITVYRWHKNYQSSAHDIRSLINNDRKKGNRSSRLDPIVQQIIDTTIKDVFLKGHKPSMSSAYEELKRIIWKENQFRLPNDALKLPSFKTFTNKIKALDPYLVKLHRDGKRAAEREFRTYQMGVTTSRPLERVEIDHTQLDLFVLDDDTKLPLGKPYITAAIDHYTGCVAGFYISFTPASVFTVMECLKVAILPKVKINQIFPKIKNTWDVFGIFETLIVDNAKEFYSLALEEACIQLGINIQYSPPYQPWFKASIERYFSTINSKLLNNLEGKTLPIKTNFPDYNPIKNALINFSSFIEIMHIWVIDIYNQSYKERVGDTPAKKWIKSVSIYPPILPQSSTEVKIILSLQNTRKILRTGISYKGLIYNSNELSLLRQKILENPNVTIKINPSNISHIFVLDPIKDEYFSVPAINQKYAEGKTLFQHEVITNNAREYAKATVNMNNLMEASERINTVINENKVSTKNRKTHSSQKVARYENISQNTVFTPKLNNEKNQETNINNDKNNFQESKTSESFYDDLDDWYSDYTLGG